MKKKAVILLLALALAGAMTACGEEKEEKSQQEETRQEEEFVLTNDEGKVVAVDVEHIGDYVELGEYKNLEVEEALKKDVTDEETQEYIHQQLLYQYPQEEVTEDRAVQMDDTVNIDYTGYLDGEAFDGGSAKGTDLLIGSGRFIDGFESGLIGHKKGEEVTLELTFPEDYESEELQGKAVEFQVKINKISQPAQLTDSWTAENTDYKTVQEYTAAQKEFLQEARDNDYESQVKSDLFVMVVKDSKIKDYPEEALREETENVRKQMDSMYQASYGMTMEEYMEEAGSTEEEIDAMVEESAKSYMEQNMIVQAVLDAEGVELTQEDYTEEEKKFASLCGFPDVETMKTMYTDEKVIKDNVLWNRACDIILSTATIKETAEEQAEE